MATALQQPEVGPGNYPSKYKSFDRSSRDGFVSEEAKRLAEQVRTERARHIQELNLQRENILSQRTSNPARRTALEAALAQIEGQIEALN